MKLDGGDKITPCWINLPEMEHPWGNLCFGQRQQPFPFPIERVYYAYGIPVHANRGGHAHKSNREVLFCLQGGCTLWLYTPEGEERCYRLEHPARGVLIPEMWWIELGEYIEGTLTLVVASQPYRESDYNRNPEDFFISKIFPDPVYRPHP